jgi:hypothetical protein
MYPGAPAFYLINNLRNYIVDSDDYSRLAASWPSARRHSRNRSFGVRRAIHPYQ